MKEFDDLVFMEEKKRELPADLHEYLFSKRKGFPVHRIRGNSSIILHKLVVLTC